MEFFFRSALRNHWRDRVFSLLNVLALSIGLASCFFVIVYINDEVSYDRFNENFDRVYRIIYRATNGNDYAQVPPPIQPLIKENIEECEYSARVYQRNLGVSFQKNGQTQGFEETGVLFVDSGFSEIFSFEVLQGSKSRFFKEPNGVVLSRETAEKFFGDGAILGQNLKVAGRYSMKVVGVVEDFPEQSHLHFSMILPYEAMYLLESEEAQPVIRNNLSKNWVISHSATYMLLNEGANRKKVDEKLAVMLDRFAPDQLKVGQSFYIEPLSDIHLLSQASLDPEPQNDVQTLFLLGITAFIIMLLATLNFVSLTTAQTFRRVREVALKKAMGASRGSLIIQFMGESFLLFLAALVGSIFLFALSLPYLNQIMAKGLRFDFLWSPLSLLSIGLLFLLVSFSGGLYPAFKLSSSEITTNLKVDKGWSYRSRKIPFRQFLLFIQFSISILLVAGSSLLYRQLDFLINKPLGFNSENVITAEIFSENLNNVFSGVTGELRSRMNTFEQETEKLGNVNSVTLSQYLPGLGAVSRMTDYQGKKTEEVEFIPCVSVDYDFLASYGIPVLEGRDFSKEMGTDHLDAFLVNQKAVEYFDWGTEDSAIGKSINVEGREGNVVGVFKDFFYQSLRSDVGPLILYIGVPHFTTFSIKVEREEVAQSITSIKAYWEDMFPEKVFDYRFLDELLKEEYSNDRYLADIIRLLALMALMVASFGSYGLIRFIAKQREKEIGVRKILGASTFSIALLLSRGYASPFIVAIVTALPISFFAGNEVLSDYAIRVNWSPWDFALGILITLLAVVSTVGIQTFRSSIANPSDSIRDE